jgi:hypothetical protein
MITVSCPSCSATVHFQSSVSILAVCEHCRSTLIRKDLNIENLGVMAELKTDASPIQLGVEGRYGNVHFTVIGRIQLQYENGIWNEWHLLFDDRRSGWLGEAQGIYTVTFLKEDKRKLPFAGIQLGQDLKLGQSREVVNIEEARCIAGEGELPFKVDAGYEAPVVDLHGEGTAFATLDYSESMEEPLVFLGEYVEFQNLQLSGLRRLEEEAAKSAKANTFQCLVCGGPLQIRALYQTASIACGNCGSVIDISNDNFRILQKAAAKLKIAPVIPLGTRGTFRGNKFEVIGFQRRRIRVEGMDYRWDEYLLFNPYIGFRWLTVYNGHWNYVEQTIFRPKVLGNGRHEHRGTTFNHFQTVRNATTEYVLGEFYWKVKAGDECMVLDYVSPPMMLSMEKTGKEVSWSVGTYVEPEEIRASFSLERPLPPRMGVYANQPSPYKETTSRVLRTFAVFCAVALLLQIFSLVMAENKTVQNSQFDFDPKAPDNAKVTPVFDLGGRSSNVVVRSHAALSNSWVFLNMALINNDTGTAYDFAREISYYTGSDSDGFWSEGGLNDAAILPDIPAGHYYLRVEPEGVSPTRYSIDVVRDVPQWRPFLIVLAVLFLFPIFAFYRRWAFERERWSESDHPWVTSTPEDDE